MRHSLVLSALTPSCSCNGSGVKSWCLTDGVRGTVLASEHHQVGLPGRCRQPDSPLLTGQILRKSDRGITEPCWESCFFLAQLCEHMLNAIACNMVKLQQSQEARLRGWRCFNCPPTWPMMSTHWTTSGKHTIVIILGPSSQKNMA